MREFLARVMTLTWRHDQGRALAGGDERRLGQGRLRIDVERRSVTVRGVPVDMTCQEFDLLHKLASRRGVVFSRTALLDSVWKGHSALILTRTPTARAIAGSRNVIAGPPANPTVEM
jgi:DNA-binding response OmpR family regulator